MTGEVIQRSRGGINFAVVAGQSRQRARNILFIDEHRDHGVILCHKFNGIEILVLFAHDAADILAIFQAAHFLEHFIEQRLFLG